MVPASYRRHILTESPMFSMPGPDGLKTFHCAARRTITSSLQGSQCHQRNTPDLRMVIRRILQRHETRGFCPLFLGTKRFGDILSSGNTKICCHLPIAQPWTPWQSRLVLVFPSLTATSSGFCVTSRQFYPRVTCFSGSVQASKTQGCDKTSILVAWKDRQMRICTYVYLARGELR